MILIKIFLIISLYYLYIKDIDLDNLINKIKNNNNKVVILYYYNKDNIKNKEIKLKFITNIINKNIELYKYNCTNNDYCNKNNIIDKNRETIVFYNNNKYEKFKNNLRFNVNNIYLFYKNIFNINLLPINNSYHFNILKQLYSKIVIYTGTNITTIKVLASVSIEYCINIIINKPDIFNLESNTIYIFSNNKLIKYNKDINNLKEYLNSLILKKKEYQYIDKSNISEVIKKSNTNLIYFYSKIIPKQIIKLFRRLKNDKYKKYLCNINNIINFKLMKYYKINFKDIPLLTIISNNKVYYYNYKYYNNKLLNLFIKKFENNSLTHTSKEKQLFTKNPLLIMDIKLFNHIYNNIKTNYKNNFIILILDFNYKTIIRIRDIIFEYLKDKKNYNIYYLPIRTIRQNNIKIAHGLFKFIKNKDSLYTKISFNLNNIIKKDVIDFIQLDNKNLENSVEL